MEDDNDGRALFNRMQLMSGRVFLTRKEPNRNTEKRTDVHHQEEKNNSIMIILGRLHVDNGPIKSKDK